MNLPSLTISFGDGAARARLQAKAGLEPDLRRMALRFRSAIQISPTVLEIEIDDLITNLRALSDWPHPTSVIWAPQLESLVSDSVRDAQTVQNWLVAPGTHKIDTQDIQPLLQPGWKGDLTEFQERDIRKLLSLRHGANFSVPGSGKTRVALAVFQSLRHQHGIERLLIIGPKSSYESWLVENTTCFSDPLKMGVMGRALDPTFDAVIVNYERLTPSTINSLGRWLDTRPAMLVLDEAHRMKLGADGTYGAACLALGPHSRHRLILTGTPAPNGVKDLENLFSFVWPGTGRQQVIKALGGGDLAAASKALRPLFTRTTKQELGLPKVTTKVRRIPLTPLHLEVYEALLGGLSARAISARDDLQELGKVLVYMLMAATSPALLAVGTTRHEPLAYQVPPLQVPQGTSLWQLMQDLPRYELSPKYQEVLKIVSDNVALGRKTLVWSTFIRSLNTLKQMLGSYSPAIVHGGTDDRESEIARFRNDASCMVLLTNPATLGEGISMHQECHDAVYVDRDFAAGRFLQSLDRIHRLGLLPGVETRITVLVSEGTIDEVVEQRLGMKLDFMGKILDDPAVQELADLEEEPINGGGLDLQDVQALMGYLRADST